MLLNAKMINKCVLAIYSQILLVSSIPLQTNLQSPVIVKAEPQVMMHTLQQPIPIDTLQSIKTQATKNHELPSEPSRHQASQNALLYKTSFQNTPNFFTDAYPYDSETNNQIPQVILSALYPFMPHILNRRQTLMENQLVNPYMPMIYQPSLEEHQQMLLQQQMMALQQLQPSLHPTQSSMPIKPMPQPLLILLPDQMTENANEDLFKNSNNPNYEETNNDGDSETIESAQTGKETRKAILLIPNAKFSIGGIISTIPWLPIEINVPDTVTWAWNGISSGIAGIISIIGSRLPFRPRPRVNVEEPSVKMFLKQLQMNNFGSIVPIYSIPYYGMIPTQF